MTKKAEQDEAALAEFFPIPAEKKQKPWIDFDGNRYSDEEVTHLKIRRASFFTERFASDSIAKHPSEPDKWVRVLDSRNAAEGSGEGG